MALTAFTVLHQPKTKASRRLLSITCLLAAGFRQTDRQTVGRRIENE